MAHNSSVGLGRYAWERNGKYRHMISNWCGSVSVGMCWHVLAWIVVYWHVLAHNSSFRLGLCWFDSDRVVTARIGEYWHMSPHLVWSGAIGKGSVSEDESGFGT